MGGVVRSSFGKPLVIVRYTTVMAANATLNILPIWPVLGFGTVRIFTESDVAFTVNLLEKQRLGTFRQTNSQAVAAATGAPLEFVLVGEYIRIQVVNGGTAMGRFVLLAGLYP